MRGLLVMGTRPEAVKLAPLILTIRENHPGWTALVCATGQHRELLNQTLAYFSITPDWNLDVMTQGQSLASGGARILSALEPVLAEARPDAVFVQGDTQTTFFGALCAFYAGVPVVHVEAGLRTGNLREPFPEELNRVLTGHLTTLHCAATQPAVDNLLAEGVPANSVVLTGNTGIDALFRIVRSQEAETAQKPVAGSDKLILVTAHRRENFGEPLRNICRALRELSGRPGIRVVYSVHPNPEVRRIVGEELQNSPVQTIEPPDYPEFVRLLQSAWITMTDSGGIQEEAPALGKPVLVLRDCTERPEAVAAGNARLVGSSVKVITETVDWLLSDPDAYASMARPNFIYGDGHASERIIEATAQRLGGR